MPTLLANHEYWINFHVLILHLLKYFKSTVNEQTISKESMKTYYKGTLRVLLVMLHDWPDFLSEFSYAFCEEIPDKFIQVRNIILAAFPRNMRPPDPFSVQHLDLIEEFKMMPQFYYPYFENKVYSLTFHTDIMLYLTSKSEEVFKSICNKLIVFENNHCNIDTSVVNVFTLAVPWLLYEKYY